MSVDYNSTMVIDTATVYVVDDDESVRKATARLLKSVGSASKRLPRRAIFWITTATKFRAAWSWTFACRG